MNRRERKDRKDGLQGQIIQILSKPCSLRPTPSTNNVKLDRGDHKEGDEKAIPRFPAFFAV